VFVLVRCAPAGSPIAGALDPRMAWTVDQCLSATRVDQLNALLWSLGGGKGKQPEPIPRPWVEDSRQIIKSERMTVQQTDDLVAAFRSGGLGGFHLREDDIEGEIE